MAHAHPESGAATTPASKLDIGDIFRGHQHEAIDRLVLDPLQRRVLERISACRTAALGGHMQTCSMNCGFERPAYNSCRDRHCPKCQATRQAKWVALRLERIVPVAHFHVVFTLPGQLRPFARANPELAYNLLFRAASQTLLAFGRDPYWLGAQLGMTIILHTWRRDLAYHPHVHCVVTAGGLSDDGKRWIKPRQGPKFLFPVRALGKVFRGKYLEALASYDPHILRGLPSTDAKFQKLLDQLHRKAWNVYAKAPINGSKHIFSYLGRYTHRVGISNQRLVEVTDTAVTFRTRDGARETLAPIDFIKRFLQHVLPKGFTKIRHYGLYASSNVDLRLPLARALVGGPAPSPPPVPQKSEVTRHEVLALLFGPDFLKCPACRRGLMQPSAPLPESPRARGPP